MVKKIENLKCKSTEIVDKRENLEKAERNNERDISSIRSVLEGYLSDDADVSKINKMISVLESDKQEIQEKNEMIRSETSATVDEVDQYTDALVRNLDIFEQIEKKSDLETESKIERSSTEKRLEELLEIRKILIDEEGMSWKTIDARNSGGVSSVELNGTMTMDSDYVGEKDITEKREHGDQLNNCGAILGMVADIIADRGNVNFTLSNVDSAKDVGEKIKKKAKEFFTSAFLKQSEMDKAYIKFHHLNSNEIDEETHEILSKIALSLVADEFTDILSKKQLQSAAKNIYLLSDEEIVNKYPEDSSEMIERKLHSGGFYQNGEVVIRKDSKAPFLKLMSIYIHELLHMKSDDSEKPHEGFLEYRTGKVCNRGINEGATELLAQQILEKNGYKMFVRAYRPLVDIAEKMQNIVGEDTFKNMYRENGLQNMRNNYDWCFSKGAFDLLLNDIEKVHDLYPAEDDSLKSSIMQRLDEYEKRKNDARYRNHKQWEVKGVKASIKPNITETDSAPTIGQRVRARGDERDD